MPIEIAPTANNSPIAIASKLNNPIDITPKLMIPKDNIHSDIIP
ncbi:hypothetical protein [Clostridium sp.]|nr:hypothetical protein [Clostridium sp.]